MDMLSHYHLNIYVYMQTLGLLTTLVREASIFAVGKD